MTAILVQGDNHGERRCDANCHEARDLICRCICGGRYHARGSTANAQMLLREDLAAGRLGAELQAAYRAACGAPPAQTELVPA